jgi:predicted transcriptional regulator of viral defense system
VKRSAKESRRALLLIAEQQQGLFTSWQAREVGYSDAARVYQAKAGNWIRLARGIYQLAEYPVADRPDLVLWSLWSRDAQEVPQGVYSHQTALSIHELTDLNPARLHMTVPRRFRRRSDIPKILILHKADLPDSDVIEMEGYRVTSALRAIVDLLRSGAVHPDVLRSGIQDGLERGQITMDEARRARDDGLLGDLADEADG